MDERINVLVVDDEPEVRDVLCEWLNDRYVTCTGAIDGVSALEILAKRAFDVVLLDIRLPRISGIDILREMRNRNSTTPIIMVTGVTEIDTAVKAMKMGAVDYIVKPFELRKVSISISFAIAMALETSLEEDFSDLDAIALGVEQRRELVDGHSRHVTESTMRVANHLGISERVINDWAARRFKRDSERKKLIGVAMAKLDRSPLAQNILGLSLSKSYPPPMPEDSRN